jgi:hypothetical protein
MTPTERLYKSITPIDCYTNTWSGSGGCYLRNFAAQSFGVHGWCIPTNTATNFLVWLDGVCE